MATTIHIDKGITVTDVTVLVSLILTGSNKIYNVVINAGDSHINYNGGNITPAKIWEKIKPNQPNFI